MYMKLPYVEQFHQKKKSSKDAVNKVDVKKAANEVRQAEVNQGMPIGGGANIP